MSASNLNLMSSTAESLCVAESPAFGHDAETNERTGLIGLSMPSCETVKSSTIMIVDDEPTTVDLLRKYLKEEGYDHFVTTTDASKCLDMMCFEQPHIVLLDIMMPQVDGLTILERVRESASTRHIPVLVLTASTDADTRLKALKAGANDFLTKPVELNELKIRVHNSLVLKSQQTQLATYSAQLEHEVQIRTAELAASRKEAIHCLARAAEYRDEQTGRHVLRVGKFVGIIARQLGYDEYPLEMLEQAAQLHDVGKMGVPDAILRKSGKLAADEYAAMQQHCLYGQTIMDDELRSGAKRLEAHSGVGGMILQSCKSPIMRLAAKIARTHHEKWNGAGYPAGLTGDKIPLEGRITAVADVFDALVSKRPYKPAFAYEESIEIMKQQRGSHFDPCVLDAFLKCKEQIVQVHVEYADEEATIR